LTPFSIGDNFYLEKFFKNAKKEFKMDEINKLKEELAEKEKEITRLKERLKVKGEQLRFSVETWQYLSHGIESLLMQANPRIHAVENEIGKE
jgi:flagellar motility protein MotE (MotC chaperone)